MAASWPQEKHQSLAPKPLSRATYDPPAPLAASRDGSAAIPQKSDWRADYENYLTRFPSMVRATTGSTGVGEEEEGPERKRSHGSSTTCATDNRRVVSFASRNYDSEEHPYHPEEPDWCAEEDRHMTSNKFGWIITHNFYTLFLLGVGLAALGLVVAGFLIADEQSDVYYDPTTGKDLVVRNQDTKMTLYLLSMGLMLVLLGGSACYCFSNWLESVEDHPVEEKTKKQVDMTIVSRWGSRVVVAKEENNTAVV